MAFPSLAQPTLGNICTMVSIGALYSGLKTLIACMGLARMPGTSATGHGKHFYDLWAQFYSCAKYSDGGNREGGSKILLASSMYKSEVISIAKLLCYFRGSISTKRLLYREAAGFVVGAYIKIYYRVISYTFYPPQFHERRLPISIEVEQPKKVVGEIRLGQLRRAQRGGGEEKAARGEMRLRSRHMGQRRGMIGKGKEA